MSFVADTLSSSGLDTLSERALRRLTDAWTGRLYTAEEADSLGSAEVERVASDETFHSIVEGWQRAREVYHEASIEDVLGASSHLSDGVAASVQSMGENLAMAEQMLTQSQWWNPVQWTPQLYNLLAVLMLAYYLFCLYRYFDDVVTLFGSIFSRRVAVAGRMGERRRSDIFYGSLGKLFVMGTAFVGLIVAAVVVRWGGVVPQETLFYMPFAVVLLFLAVIVVQNLMLGLVGAVTRSIDDVAALLRIRLAYFVLAILLSAPILLMAVVAQGVEYRIWFTVAGVAVGVAVILFVRESIGFFISKKVSILHWILYLCTVEIMPLSLLWQAAKSLR